MTTHLSPDEFVDAAEGTLAEVRRAHLDGCDPCRASVAELSGLMREVQATDDRPEPAPIFWDQFSDRVRAATRAEVIPVRSWWHDAWRPIAGVAALAAALLLMVELRAPRTAPVSRAARAESVAASASGGASVLDAAAPAEDDAMSFVTQLAADVPWDDLEQVAQPSRDATAAAVDELTAAQRAELARLVKAAMDGAE